MKVVLTLTTWFALSTSFVAVVLGEDNAGPAGAPPPLEASASELVEPTPQPPSFAPDVPPRGGPVIGPGEFDPRSESSNPLRIPQAAAFPATEPAASTGTMPTAVPGGPRVDRVPSVAPGISGRPKPEAVHIGRAATGQRGTRPPTAPAPPAKQPMPGTGTLLVWVVLGLGVSLGLAQRHRIVGHRRAVRRPWTPESRENILSIVNQGRHDSPAGDWLEIDSPW